MDLAVARSPNHLRTSLAGVLALGLRPGRFFRHARLHCLNLLLTYPKGCAGRCAYCGIASGPSRARGEDPSSFIRVEWPAYPLDLILDRLAEEAASPDPALHRVCISMITRKQAANDTLDTIKAIRARSPLPISVLVAPTVTSADNLAAFAAAGADKIGVAIDAATPELFETLRGKGVSGPHRLDRYQACIREAMEIFGPANVGMHLMVGLGETERDLVASIACMRSMGGETHLFSFFPEPGSLLEKNEAPPLDSYRRIQMARYLIDNDLVEPSALSFGSSEEIVDFGLPRPTLFKVMESGEPFRTSGCAGRSGQPVCNRPYANSPLSRQIRNYPFVPWSSDLDEIRRCLDPAARRG